MAIPVTLEDARRQLRLADDDTSQDDELQGFIADAAAWVEGYTGLILVARDVDLPARVPSTALDLTGWPIKADAVVTATVDGAPLAGVRLDVSRRPARLLPALSQCWPMSRADQILMVTYRAGYEPGDVMPRNIRRAMLVLIGAYDADREGGDILAKAEASAKSLCRYFRVNRL